MSIGLLWLALNQMTFMGQHSGLCMMPTPTAWLPTAIFSVPPAAGPTHMNLWEAFRSFLLFIITNV